MRKADIFRAVMKFSSDVLDVDISDEAGSVSIAVTIKPMSPDAEYNLRTGIITLLEPARPMGISRLTVTIKLSGRLDEKKIREGDPALVVSSGDSEPSYFRLDITN